MRTGVAEEKVDAKAWWWILAALMFALLSPSAGFAARATSGGWFWCWVVVQVVATGLAFVIPQARQVLASRSEVEVRVETRVAMNDALDPILRLLGNLALAPDRGARAEMRAQTIPLVLATAAEFIGPERSRACWFKLEQGDPIRLVPGEAVGRAGSPSTTFRAGTRAGDAAIEMVMRDEDRLCEDIEIAPPPGWDPSKTRDYRTFISVSVIAGDTAYGMLTLDAPDPGSLVTEDMGLLRLMGGLLAVALSIR